MSRLFATPPPTAPAGRTEDDAVARAVKATQKAQRRAFRALLSRKGLGEWHELMEEAKLGSALEMMEWRNGLLDTSGAPERRDVDRAMGEVLAIAGRRGGWVGIPPQEDDRREDWADIVNVARHEGQTDSREMSRAVRETEHGKGRDRRRRSRSRSRSRGHGTDSSDSDEGKERERMSKEERRKADDRKLVKAHRAARAADRHQDARLGRAQLEVDAGRARRVPEREQAARLQPLPVELRDGPQRRLARPDAHSGDALRQPHQPHPRGGPRNRNLREREGTQGLRRREHDWARHRAGDAGRARRRGPHCVRRAHHLLNVDAQGAGRRHRAGRRRVGPCHPQHPRAVVPRGLGQDAHGEGAGPRRAHQDPRLGRPFHAAQPQAARP